MADTVLPTKSLNNVFECINPPEQNLLLLLTEVTDIILKKVRAVAETSNKNNKTCILINKFIQFNLNNVYNRQM